MRDTCNATSKEWAVIKLLFPFSVNGALSVDDVRLFVCLYA